MAKLVLLTVNVKNYFTRMYLLIGQYMKFALKFVTVYKGYLCYNEQTRPLIILTICACCMWQTLILTLPNLPSSEVWSRPQAGDFLPPSVPMAEVIEKSKVSPQKLYGAVATIRVVWHKKQKRSHVLAHAFIFGIRMGWYWTL